MKKMNLIGIMALFSAVPAFAEESAAVAVTTVTNNAYYGLAAGLAIGVAALGGALGQGRIGAAAMDGIARNPQASKEMFVPMIVGLALVESLVIYALVIAFMLQGKAV